MHIFGQKPSDNDDGVQLTLFGDMRRPPSPPKYLLGDDHSGVFACLWKGEGVCQGVSILLSEHNDIKKKHYIPFLPNLKRAGQM